MPVLLSLLSFFILFNFANSAGAEYEIINDGSGGDCTAIGIWDQDTLSCKLLDNVYDTIIIRNIAGSGIDNSGITLDGNGFSILNDSNSPIGVYIYGIPGRDPNPAIPIESITVKNLTISGFETGIHLVYGSGCKIYHNNFIDNTVQAVNTLGSNNVFSLDAPIGGNYWSDTDISNFPECADKNADGFFDCPYTFSDGEDLLPWAIESGWDLDATQVSLDIKPGSCSNRINVKSWRAKLPVAILGAFDFDVNGIDPSSLRLNGVAPIRSAVRDIVSPEEEDGDNDGCNNRGDDGYPDLVLKFNLNDLLATLGAVNDGEQRTLTLTGSLKNGAPITGSDAVTVIKKEKKELKKHTKKVKSLKDKKSNTASKRR